MRTQHKSIAFLLCLSLLAMHSGAWAGLSKELMPVDQIMSIVPAVLNKTIPPPRVELLYISDHPVILIGESNHEDPKYRELSRLFHQMAVDRELAFFKEALPRDQEIEQRWSQFLLENQESDTGWFFGGEDDLAYLISDWATELGRFRFSGGKREKAQNVNFMLKFIFSKKAKPIWNIFTQYATSAPFSEMAAVLGPQIAAVESLRSSEGLLIPPVQEDFTPSQWAMLHLALLQIASTDEDLPEGARAADLRDLLKDPMNPNAIVKFNDSFGRIYRSERMIANIQNTISSLPPEVPIVILVGEGHVNDLIQGLSMTTSVAD